MLWSWEKAVVAGSGHGWRAGPGSCGGIDHGKSLIFCS